jgi:antitoxin (DNA-binding transcriptional repressor) of toxin-antitoxin stability system
MILIDVSDAEAQFDSLLDRVAQGEEFLILRDGKPVARMIAEKSTATAGASGKAPDPGVDK